MDRQSSSRLRARPMVMGLPDRFASTVAPASASPTRRRRRHPHVLADLDAEREARHVPGGEEQVRAERRLQAGDPDGLAAKPGAGREMALLVELAVVGQVALRHDAQHRAAMDHHGRVVEAVAPAQRRPDDQHRQEVAAAVDQRQHRGLDGVEQRRLEEQVVERVARDESSGNTARPAPPARGPRARPPGWLGRCRPARRSRSRPCRPRRAGSRGHRST